MYSVVAKVMFVCVGVAEARSGLNPGSKQSEFFQNWDSQGTNTRDMTLYELQTQASETCVGTGRQSFMTFRMFDPQIPVSNQLWCRPHSPF